MGENSHGGNVDSVAQAYGVSAAFVRRLISEGKLAARRANNRTLILFSEFEVAAKQLPPQRSPNNIKQGE